MFVEHHFLLERKIIECTKQKEAKGDFFYLPMTMYTHTHTHACMDVGMPALGKVRNLPLALAVLLLAL